MRQNSKKNFKYSQKNQSFFYLKTSAQHLKSKFYTNKQKQILTQKLRIKKITNTFLVKLFELSQQKKSHILQKVINNLKKKIYKNQLEMKKIDKIYAFLLRVNKSSYKKKKKHIF